MVPMTPVMTMTMIISSKVTPRIAVGRVPCDGLGLWQRIGRITHSVALQRDLRVVRARYRHGNQERLISWDCTDSLSIDSDGRAVAIEPRCHRAIDVGYGIDGKSVVIANVVECRTRFALWSQRDPALVV